MFPKPTPAAGGAAANAGVLSSLSGGNSAANTNATNNGGITGGSMNDYEPLTDEIPPDGIIFATNRNVPGSLIVFRTHEEKSKNPEVSKRK
jgi:hypothetical protein